ncbi:EAL domain-containing response regulator [Microcoleus sp. FACHB-SPT15]|uniref:putative bifunctional diguanylate cyclase/phosphodiesterase n=1 Tax=Microcoleus sp. FACHB-SPT15 TaxID=2692830 RepID=UPI001785502C|nr:EAL domain-containing response regulator [Microcoleus sp. FACHB-SPT15]MBD1803915.1 EAL domain-containing response regulator [Microcoleus sp. FACHB-SPT15]
MSLPLRVLIVSDLEDHTELLVNVVKQGGYDLTCERVHTAATFITALENQQWDIIFSNYSLPDFNATAALSLLQEKRLGLPFIVVPDGIGNDQPEGFVRAADTALHYAQSLGRGRTASFNGGRQTTAMELLQLETDLQQAIKSQQLFVFYQPIVSLFTGTITGFEALVRWQHPTRGLVSPTAFITLAEETGLIIPLGLWVLQEACQQLRVWQQQFPHYSSLNISVNLSGIQLAQPDLLESIDEVLARVGLSSHCLKLEITESMLVEDFDSAVTVLQQLQERQIQVCLDDFGTGYSSLSYLHRLPIDILKIDRSFINPGEGNGKNLDIVKSIMSLAHSLELDVVAEGVETGEQLNWLRALSCEYGQGYFFSKPIDSQAVGALLTGM